MVDQYLGNDSLEPFERIFVGFTGILTVFLWSFKFSLYVGNRYFIWSLVCGDPAPQTFLDRCGQGERRYKKRRRGGWDPRSFGMGHIKV